MHPTLSRFLRAALIAGLSITAHAAPGDLDPTFDGDGRMKSAFNQRSSAEAIVVQADGRLVLAGTAFNGVATVAPVARFMPNGAPDTTFNGSGATTLSYSANGSTHARAVAMQADGRLVVAGHVWDGASRFLAARLRGDGSPDTSFANGAGHVMVDFPGTTSPEAHALAIQPDGKLLLAGDTFVDGARAIAVARLNADGTLDNTFNGNGRATRASGSVAIRTVLVQSDGRIVVGGTHLAVTPTGSSVHSLVFARFNADGTRDAGFGNDGLVLTDVDAWWSETAKVALVQLPGGKLLAAASTSAGNFVFVRYEATGRPDPNFGDAGIGVKVMPSDVSVAGLSVLPDGGFLVGGAMFNGTIDEGLIARFTADGTFYQAFAAGGRATAAFPTGTFSVRGMAVQADGRVVLAGSNEHLAAMRFEMEGGTATARAGDFSGDGRPDLLVRNTASGATYLWRMDGLRLAGDQHLATIDPSWQLIGQGDFDGDGHGDIVWRNRASGAAYVWYLRNGAFLADAFLFAIDPAWAVESVNDFDRDGRPDFLFRHATQGTGFLWHFRNTVPAGDRYLFTIDNQWLVENTGDFDGDGYPDFIFRNRDTGLAFVWKYDGSRLGDSFNLFSTDPRWQIVQVADWNGDGKPDLVMHHRETGVTFAWYTDGTRLIGSDTLFQLDPVWRIVPHLPEGP